MIIVTTHTRAEAGAVVARALEFTGEVSVTNVSGSVDAWEVSFDASVVCNEQELAAVCGANQWRDDKAAAANYIRVDEDGSQIDVYDSLGDVGRCFDTGTRLQRRAAAEAFAKAEAARLGCDWGTNYH